MSINQDLLTDFQLKMIQEMQDSIYKKLNSKINSYLNSITFSKENEAEKLETINFDNYYKVQESNMNILKICKNQADLAEPEEISEEIKNQYDSAISRMNRGDVYDSYEYYELSERCNRLRGFILSNRQKRDEYEKAINSTKANVVVYNLPTIKVDEIDYKASYEAIKEEVINHVK